jgi:hypothetical protein
MSEPSAKPKICSGVEMRSARLALELDLFGIGREGEQEALIDRERAAQGARQPLKCRLRDMMRIFAVERLEVNIHRGMDGKCLILQNA